MFRRSPCRASISHCTFHMICLHGREAGKRTNWGNDEWCKMNLHRTFSLCLLPGRKPTWRKSIYFSPSVLIKPGRLAEQKAFYTIQYFCCFHGGKGTEAGWPLPSIRNSFQSIHSSFPSFYPSHPTSFTTTMPEEIFFKTVPFPYIGPKYRS
jgi:hypothetical protein